MSDQPSLRATARDHRRAAAQTEQRIRYARLEVQRAVDDNRDTKPHTDHLVALEREHALWLQLASEIDTYLALPTPGHEHEAIGLEASEHQGDLFATGGGQ